MTKSLFIFDLMAILVWSCSDPTSSDSKYAWSILPYENATKIATPADSLMDLAQQIPGFGGLFFNKSGQLTIFLTHPDKQKAKAKTVLLYSRLIKKASSITAASVENMAVKKGDYIFIRLHSWKIQIEHDILPMDSVYLVGIDQSRNKVDIGVENKAVRNQVIKKLPQINIPKQAVIFYQMTPPQLD